MSSRETGPPEKEQLPEPTGPSGVAATPLPTRAVLRVLLTIFIFSLVLWLLYSLQGVILLVVLSIFLAYLLAPLVELVRRTIKIRGNPLSRVLAIGLVYFVIFSGIGTALYFLLPRIGVQVTQLAQRAPDYIVAVRERVQNLDRLYRGSQIPPEARETIAETVTRVTAAAEEQVRSGLVGLASSLSFLPLLLLVPILAFFMLKDAENLRHAMLELIPPGRLRWYGDEFLFDVNRTLAAYTRAQVIAALLIGTVCAIGFALMRVPYALVLGIMAGFLEFVPLFGPLSLAIFAALVASFYSSSQVLAVLLFLAVLRVIHDYVTYPRIIGQGVHLHPLVVILVLLCGAELAGVAGIILAIPVTAIISVTYRRLLVYRDIERMLQELTPQATTAAATPPPGKTTEAGDSPPTASERPRLELTSRKSGSSGPRSE